MEVRLLKYQKDAAKSERLKKEAAELILAEKEWTWGMYRIEWLELGTYLKQRNFCHWVPRGQGCRNSLGKWERESACYWVKCIKIDKSQRKKIQSRNCCFPVITKSHASLHWIIYACRGCLWVPFFLLWEEGPVYTIPAGLCWCIFPSYGAQIQR